MIGIPLKGIEIPVWHVAVTLDSSFCCLTRDSERLFGKLFCMLFSFHLNNNKPEDMRHRYDCKKQKQMSIISEGSYGSLISFPQAVQI